MSRIAFTIGLVSLMWVATSSPAAPLGTVFTYQGQLKDNGSPADGPVQMTFKLFDAETLGNQVGPTLMPPPVTVTNGLFTVKLDFGSGAYTGDQRWLEITVEGFPLTPRQELTAAPFALKTRGVDGHSLDSANGAITDAAFVNNNGRMGVGMSAPRMSLEVRRNDLWYNLPSIGASSSDTLYAYLHAGSTDHALIWNNNSDMRFGMESSPGAGFTERMRLTDTGNLGIGTTLPGNRLSIAGGLTVDVNSTNSGTAANALRFGGDGHGEAIGSKKTVGGNQHGLDFYTSHANRMSITNGGNVGIANAAPAQRLVLGNFFDAGDTYAEIETLGGNAYRAGLRLRHFNDTNGWTVESDERHSSYGLNFIRHSSSPAGVSAMFIHFETGNVGVGTSTPAAKLDVVGTTRTQVIQITGGADIAEPFDVREGGETKPGMVVCIDPQEIGKLQLATRPYDRTVAGVVSGANGVQPGMVLQQLGRQDAGGKHPIALSGRVWVLADATAGGAITAGDLLTTSGTPGHAMKVSDYARANGAILGKAMSSLESGRGLVLVLVGLQ